MSGGISDCQNLVGGCCLEGEAKNADKQNAQHSPRDTGSSVGGSRVPGEVKPRRGLRSGFAALSPCGFGPTITSLRPKSPSVMDLLIKLNDGCIHAYGD